jgi:hypothetical protein
MSPNSQGIDTIELVAKYEVFKKMADNMGLTLHPMAKNHKQYEKLIDEVEEDTTPRRYKEGFKPMIEVIKLPKVSPKDKDLYISITRNTPLLFDVAKHHKKAKDSYCLVTFAGLHQPTKKISSDAMKIVSKFLKRKAFKLHALEIATDTQDKREIGEAHKNGFKADLMPYSKHGVNLEQTSYYINHVEHSSMSKIIYYDKYKKQLDQQKKERITEDLKAWRRLEVRLTFDVTKPSNKGFKSYIEGMEFIEDVESIHKVLELAKVKNYDTDYLIYQINSLLDKRFMNNHESKKQFNSVESLARFKMSDFRRWTLAI